MSETTIAELLIVLILVAAVVAIVTTYYVQLRLAKKKALADLREAGLQLDDICSSIKIDGMVEFSAGNYAVIYSLYKHRGTWKLYHNNPDTGERVRLTDDQVNDDLAELKRRASALNELKPAAA